MPTPNEAAGNVNAAVAAAREGRLGQAFQILKQGNAYPGGGPAKGDGGQYPGGGPARGDDGPYPGGGPAPGDDEGFPQVDYPTDDEIGGWYPYNPPFGRTPAPPDPNYPAVPPTPPAPPSGWYPDPFDGKGQRFWNGMGWTELVLD